MAGEKDQSKDKPKKFVGFCRISLTDNDGVKKWLKGSSAQAAVHETIAENGDHVFSAYFSPTDPLNFFALTNSREEFLSAVWWAGPGPKDGKVTATSILCRLEHRDCKKIHALATESGDGAIEATAIMPLVPNCFERTVPVMITTKQLKHELRIIKMMVTVSDTMFQEWTSYFEALKEFEKDKKDEDKDKKEEEDKDKKSESA